MRLKARRAATAEYISMHGKPPPESFCEKLTRCGRRRRDIDEEMIEKTKRARETALLKVDNAEERVQGRRAATDASEITDNMKKLQAAK